MKQKKSTLKEIKATVMPQTAEGLQMLMEETGLTIGEVIDRLTLQMRPDDLGFAVCFAQDQVFFSISNLPEEEQEEALTKIIIFLAGLVPVDHLKGLEQAAISKRAERLCMGLTIPLVISFSPSRTASSHCMSFPFFTQK